MIPRNRTADGSHSDAFPWCTTDHGRVLHVDDEDHRSEGIAVEVEARPPEGQARATVIEAGLLRRQSDTQTWFIVEDGRSIHQELTLDSARRLWRAVQADDTLRAAIEL